MGLVDPGIVLEVVDISSVLATAELMSDEFELSGDVMDELEVVPRSVAVIED